MKQTGPTPDRAIEKDVVRITLDPRFVDFPTINHIDQLHTELILKSVPLNYVVSIHTPIQVHCTYQGLHEIISELSQDSQHSRLAVRAVVQFNTNH